MKLTITNGMASFDIDALFSCMTKNQLVSIADNLSCHEEVIKNVADQIILGFTDQSSCGQSQFPINPDMLDALDAARKRIAENEGDVKSEYIGKLERSIRQLNIRNRELSEWLSLLQNKEK